MIGLMRRRFGSVALFFYNRLSPEVIGVVWRPQSFRNQPFSAMNSEFARPVSHAEWKSDTLVVDNMADILRELSQYSKDIVLDVKVLDDKTVKSPKSSLIRQEEHSSRKRKDATEEEEDESSTDESESDSASDSASDSEG